MGRKEEEGRGIVHMWLESVAYPINCSCSFSAYLNRRTLLSLAIIRSWYSNVLGHCSTLRERPDITVDSPSFERTEGRTTTPRVDHDLPIFIPFNPFLVAPPFLFSPFTSTILAPSTSTVTLRSVRTHTVGAPASVFFCQ